MTAAKKTHKITLIPGDGIGPEVSGAVVRVLEAAGAARGAQQLVAPRAREPPEHTGPDQELSLAGFQGGEDVTGQVVPRVEQPAGQSRQHAPSFRR